MCATISRILFIFNQMLLGRVERLMKWLLWLIRNIQKMSAQLHLNSLFENYLTKFLLPIFLQ